VPPFSSKVLGYWTLKMTERKKINPFDKKRFLFMGYPYFPDLGAITVKILNLENTDGLLG
jgi:hypothetical protein